MYCIPKISELHRKLKICIRSSYKSLYDKCATVCIVRDLGGWIFPEGMAGCSSSVLSTVIIRVFFSSNPLFNALFSTIEREREKKAL